MDCISICQGDESGEGGYSLMEVKIIAVDGRSTLIEWVDNGIVYRGILPSSSIRGDGFVYKKELKRAAPYGIPWEEVVILKATSELLAQNLRQAGIWTAQDVYDHPEKVQGVIMATYGIDYHTLLRIANQEVKHGN